MSHEEVVKTSEAQKEDDALQRKKSDDIWASFLSDVGSRPKDRTTASQPSHTQKVNVPKNYILS